VAALTDTAAAGAQLREKFERLLQEVLDQVVRCELVQLGLLGVIAGADREPYTRQSL
jgi:hypothetical protein